MTEAALKARKEYARQYRAKNRDRLNEYKRKWRKANPEKVNEYTERYWNKKAAEMKGSEMNENE